jgi:hypothetical protein
VRTGVDDAVARYWQASEAADIDALMTTLAPDAELVSPLSGRLVFELADDGRIQRMRRICARGWA